MMHVYLHLPGRSRFWAFQPSVTSKWSTIISVGIRSERLGSDEVPADADSAEVCAQLVNKVRSETGEHPVEVSVGREGPSGTDDGEPDPQAGTPPAGQSNHLIPRASARPSAHLTRVGALGAGAVVLVLPFLLTASHRRGC
ncbi:hypothetical protein [Streptomyces flaveus]|uniref:hypothetical protein n=1 Tax=Streptomyces flaveus TaxID=66370 RepID=UPI00332D6754